VDESLDRLILSRLVDPRKVDPKVLARSLVEIASSEDLERCRELDVAGLVGRGQEAPGVCGELSSFVVFQLLKKHRGARPVWMTGVMGPALVQAYRSEGISGVVLSADLRSRGLGSETRLRVPVGEGGAQVRLWGSHQEVAACGRQDTLEASYRSGLWAPAGEDLWVGEAREVVERLLALWEITPEGLPCGNLLTAGSPYCRQWNSPLPVIQGPLSRISVSPEFSRCVALAGGFPYLALAGLSLEEAADLLKKTSCQGHAYGVGLVGVGLSSEMFDDWVQLLLRYTPERVLLAAPQLDQVSRLLETGLSLFVHAPTPAIFQTLYEIGVRNFVLEGEEAGGHISTLGSLTLWQECLQMVRGRGWAEGVTMVFAGGVQDASSLLSSLIHFSGLGKDLRFAVQMGTAYLTTPEMVRWGPLSRAYQQQILEASETLVTGESLGLRVRQVKTSSMEDLKKSEGEIFRSDLPPEEKRRQIEACYLGGLRRAIESEETVSEESYMAGSVVCLLEEEMDVKTLHQRVTGGNQGGAPKQVPIATETTTSEPIAVIGVGALMPGAPNAPEFFRNILRRRCFVREIPGDLWETGVFLDPSRDQPLTTYSSLAGLVGKVAFDSGAFRIPPNVAEQMDRSQKLALLACQEALEDAGYLEREFDRGRFGVILGNSMGGDAADRSAQAVHSKRMASRLLTLARENEHEAILEALLGAYQDRFPEVEVNEDTLPGELSNVISGRVAWAFDLHGENYTVDAACASSLAAVAAAVESLRSGRTDMVLTGGVDTQTDVGTFIKFSRLTALSAEGSFPFDARGDGFVIGEGCGVFLLKRYQDALRDGDSIYGLILGVGSSSDGAGQGITAPRFETQVLAMQRAYQDAGVDPKRLHFLECHGTGTVLGDATEIRSVEEFWRGGERRLPIGSVKAQVGHLKAGSGAAGLLRGLLAVHGRILPPQVNFETPREELKGGALRVVERAELLPDGDLLAGVSSFGFGGTNFHLALGSTPAGGREAVVDSKRFVHPDPGPLRGDLAFLFPGQGSQYLGMLQELREDPDVAEIWQRADAVFHELQGTTLSELVYPTRAERKANKAKVEAGLRDTAAAQPAIFACSAILLKKVRALGIEPAMMIGHSLGEYSALYAAGVLSFEDTLRTVSLRGLSMKERSGEDAGAMAFLACGPEVAGELCEQVGGYVVVANLNAYDQTVISGEADPVEEVVALAEAAGLGARRLPVAAAFHSKLVAESAHDMARTLEEAELRPPQYPIPANLTGRLYPHGRKGEGLTQEQRSEVIELLTLQIEAPVDFVSQIELAYQAGIRRFVEIGPKNILARLVDGILQGKSFQSIWLDRRRQDVRPKLEALPQDLKLPLEISRQPLPSSPAVLPRKPSRTVLDAAVTSQEGPEEAIRRVIAEISGYAPERIGLDDDLERDLGIDTLKIFEIFSRLRATLLPPQVQNFRELTTIGKILSAVQRRRESVSESPPCPENFELLEVQEREVPQAKLGREETRFQPGTILTQGDRSLLDDLPVLKSLVTPEGRDQVLLLKLPACKETLREALFWLRERLLAWAEMEQESGGGRRVKVVSVNPRQGFSRSGYRALAGFFKAVKKDLAPVRLGYLHLEGEPGGGELQALLGVEAPNRRRDAEGRQFEPRLLPLSPVPGEVDLGRLLGPEDVVLVSGGARGIAASLVRDLLPRTQARFLLLGRSPGAPEWVAAAGADRVEYLCCDVANWDAVEECQLASRGTTLVVHAAGVEFSRNLRQKTKEEISRVLDPKVAGVENLCRAFAGVPLRGVMFFSSLAGLFGNHGQADYAAANGYLSGFPFPQVPVYSVAWPPWSEVGMASRGDVFEVLKLSGVAFLTPDQGAEIFRKLLGSMLGEGMGRTRSVAVMSELGGDFILPEETLLQEFRPPLLKGGRMDLAYRFDLEASPYLQDHCINGRYYLPAVSLMRQFLKRAEGMGSVDSVEFRDVAFLSALVFEDGEVRSFRVSGEGCHYVVEADQGGGFAPMVELDFRPCCLETPEEEAAQELCHSLTKRLQSPLLPFATKDIRVSREEIYRTYFHGPQFQVLDAFVAHRGDVLEARVRLSGEECPLRDFGSVPLLLEAFFHTAGLATTIHIDCPYFYIPATVGQCRVFRARCAEATSARVLVEILGEGDRKRFQGVVLDQEGQVLLEIRDLIMARSKEEVPYRKAILTHGTPLHLGGCEVLLLNVEEVVAAADGDLSAFFTSKEQEEISQAGGEERRRQRLAGRMAAKILAQKVMKEQSGRRYGLDTFEVLSDGTPPRVRFLGPPQLETLMDGFSFSVSHSGWRAAACVARGPCAVDLEVLRPLASEASQRVASASEFSEMEAEIARLEGNSKCQRYYQQALPLVCFTLKEAVLKAAGVGLGGGYDGVILDHVALSTPMRARFQGTSYRLLSVFDESHVLTVARFEEDRGNGAP
jgi:3-oxoacyl-(acyl-carrier-protein) synthase/malonyl CoA-acyl carrier protein transacylase/NAD(P)H-dependent flavin oxidoreductase YrpB (nitropropane dioxygenase family)/phosphopantetheinyl transferase